MLMIGGIDVVDGVILSEDTLYSYTIASYTIVTYIDYAIAACTDLVTILRMASLSIKNKSRGLPAGDLNRINVISVDKESYRRI